MGEAGRPREFDEEAVIEKGINFFRTYGYTGGSMSNLLEHLGINRQSLYNSFGNKKDFFLKCLGVYRKKSYEKIFLPLLASDADCNTLLAVAEKMIDRLITEPEKNCLVVKSAMELGRSDLLIAEQIELHSANLRKALLNVVKNEQKKQGRSFPAMSNAVDMGISIIFGLHVMARGGADRESLSKSVKGYIDFLTIN